MSEIDARFDYETVKYIAFLGLFNKRTKGVALRWFTLARQQRVNLFIEGELIKLDGILDEAQPLKLMALLIKAICLLTHSQTCFKVSIRC